MFSAIVSKVLALICAIAFIINTIFSLSDQITATKVTKIQKKLSDIGFPVILKIAVRPGFNVDSLKAAGYGSVDDYFMGQSRFHNDTFGWAGHTAEGGTVGTVEQIFNQVTPSQKLSDVLTSFDVYTTEREKYNLGLDFVKADNAMAYPNNMFRLEASKLLEATHQNSKGKTINTLLLGFKLQANQILTVIIEGKTTEVKRPVAQNKYFTSGQQISIQKDKVKLMSSYYTIGFRQEVRGHIIISLMISSVFLDCLGSINSRMRQLPKQ